MNLRHLEVFHAIMTAGSVTEAARALNVAQPSVSTVLKHAEDQLGIKLFHRGGGRLIPTPEADQLFPEVDRIFSQLGMLDRFTKDLRGGRSGYLALIANPTLSSTILPVAINRFRKSFPEIRIRLQTVIAAVEAAERVGRREFDLGIIYGPNRDIDVGAELIGHTRIVCVLREEHPLAARAVIRPADLEGQDVITFGVGSPMRILVEDSFRDAGQELNPVVQASFSAAACSLAQQAIGIAFVDRLVLTDVALRDLVARPFEPVRPFEIKALSPKNRPQSRISAQFVGVLRTVIEDMTRGHDPH